MKDKIHWTWKRIVGTVLGILGIGTLTSCYGVYDDDLDYNDNSYHDVYGTVSGTIDGEKQPIRNIVVSLSKKSNDETLSSPALNYTSKEGLFYFYSKTEGDYELCFTDIDGTENGSFKQLKKEISIAKKDVSLSVELENADPE